MRFITVCLFMIFAQAFFCAAGASEWQASCFRGTALVKETAERAELYYDFGGNDGVEEVITAFRKQLEL